MDHNKDFGINIGQDTTTSSSENREKNFQPGYGSDMRNATQNFISAELGGGFAQQPKNAQDTSMHNIMSQIPVELHTEMKSDQHNPFTDHNDDDEFEHDSLNFSPTIPKSTAENVKFISSTDLLDDFDTAKNIILKPEKAEQKLNQIINDGKNEIIANIGNPVNLEFKVEPDNVKLISSDTLLDDFGLSKPLVPGKEQMKAESPSLVSTAKVDFHVDPNQGNKISDTLLEDFGFGKPIAKNPVAPERGNKQFSHYDDEFFASSSNLSPIKTTKTNNDSDNENFISAENFDSFKPTTNKAEDIKILKDISKAADEIKEKKPVITKPVTNIFKTEPPKTNIMQGEVIFHKPSGAGKSNFNIHPQLESLIYWRDVKISGIIFGIGLIILLALTIFSVISVVAYTSIIALVGTIGFRIYKYVLGMLNDKQEGHPFEEYLRSDIEISQERVKQICNVSAANANAFVTDLKKLFLVEDFAESIKFGIILWFLTYIGSWFNGMTLIILAYILIFTIPILYEQNKQIIDQNMEFARSKVAELTEKIQAVIPFGGNQAIDTDKNK